VHGGKEKCKCIIDAGVYIHDDGSLTHME
jgi:hypothetical protein